MDYGDKPAAAKRSLLTPPRWSLFAPPLTSVYVLVAIIKKRLNLDLSLYTILQILSITVFERLPINQVLTDTEYRPHGMVSHNQLNLFDD